MTTRTTSRWAMVLMLAAALLLALSCASAPKKKKKKLPPPPTGEVAQLESTDAHFGEVRKAAVEQLECPEEQIILQCTRRDRDNNCIAIRASGCDKQFEYLFGTE
jgi:hypothetical protein